MRYCVYIKKKQSAVTAKCSVKCFIRFKTSLLNSCCSRYNDSLVSTGVVAFLPREAVHATDDPGVHLGPVLVTDLSPLASIFHLNKALGDGDPLPVGVSGPNPHILHLHIRSLGNKAEEMIHHCLGYYG